MNDRPYYPWKEGDHLYASELNAAIANASAMPPVLSGGATNAIWYGADPTGMTDSSTAINEALAARHDGRPLDVFLPAGIYLLCCPIMVGDPVYAQRLFGNGWSTILTVNPGFQADAEGVILIHPDPYNGQMAQASVCDLRIHFQQPPDFSTTVTGGGTPVGGHDILVTDVSGIHVGYYCYNMTNGAAFPSQTVSPKVTDIRGTLITLDQAVLQTVDAGDVLVFAANRSQMVDLGAGSLAPGSPGIKYPWAVHVVAQSVFIDHLIVTAGWNGVYIRGQTFVIGQYIAGCMNISLDIDECFNFPKISHFMHHAYGLSYGMVGVFYDGETIAANLGECDGLACDTLQTWTGILNFTATWSWGAINYLSLDGDNANWNIVTTNPNSWVQIGKLYKTSGLNGIGVPLLLSGPCIVTIESIFMVGAQNNPHISMSNGSLTVAGGFMWGVSGPNPLIHVAGGGLSMDQMRFDSPADHSPAYLTHTGGYVRVNNSDFVTPPAPGAAAFILVDDARNSITNVRLNGRIFNPPGPLGRYEVIDGTGIVYSNKTSTFVGPDTPTTAQVTVRPDPNGPAGQEGKLRLYGVFPPGSDLFPRLSASIRAGFGSALWFGPYLDFWLANGPNDVGSDANMQMVARFTFDGIVLPGLAAGAPHANDAAAAAGGVQIGGLYRNGSQVMVRVT